MCYAHTLLCEMPAEHLNPVAASTAALISSTITAPMVSCRSGQSGLSKDSDASHSSKPRCRSSSRKRTQKGSQEDTMWHFLLSPAKGPAASASPSQQPQASVSAFQPQGGEAGTLKAMHCGKHSPHLSRRRFGEDKAGGAGPSRGRGSVRTLPAGISSVRALPAGIGAGLCGQSLHEGAGQQRGRQGAPAQLAQPVARAARQVQVRLVDARALDGGEARQHLHHLGAGLPVPAGRRARAQPPPRATREARAAAATPGPHSHRVRSALPRACGTRASASSGHSARASDAHIPRDTPKARAS